MKPNLSEADVERIWRHSVLPYIEERLFGSSRPCRRVRPGRVLRAKATPGSEPEASEEHPDEPANGGPGSVE